MDVKQELLGNTVAVAAPQTPQLGAELECRAKNICKINTK